jgi:hypothetical protein
MTVYEPSSSPGKSVVFKRQSARLSILNPLVGLTNVLDGAGWSYNIKELVALTQVHPPLRTLYQIPQNRLTL